MLILSGLLTMFSFTDVLLCITKAGKCYGWHKLQVIITFNFISVYRNPSTKLPLLTPGSCLQNSKILYVYEVRSEMKKDGVKVAIPSDSRHNFCVDGVGRYSMIKCRLWPQMPPINCKVQLDRAPVRKFKIKLYVPVLKVTLVKLLPVFV